MAPTLVDKDILNEVASEYKGVLYKANDIIEADDIQVALESDGTLIASYEIDASEELEQARGD